MYYLDGESVESVAAVLGKSVGTVKSLVHRAREKLRGPLAALGDEVLGALGGGRLPEEFAMRIADIIEAARRGDAATVARLLSHDRTLVERQGRARQDAAPLGGGGRSARAGRAADRRRRRPRAADQLGRDRPRVGRDDGQRGGGPAAAGARRARSEPVHRGRARADRRGRIVPRAGPARAGGRPAAARRGRPVRHPARHRLDEGRRRVGRLLHRMPRRPPRRRAAAARARRRHRREGTLRRHRAARAALNGHGDVVRWLLERGAALDGRDARFDSTPEGWALETGHADLAALIAEAARAAAANFKST